MAKTRLNVGKRDVLKQLVIDKVKHSPWDDEIDTLAVSIEEWVQKEIRKTWPVEEMEILKKWGQSTERNAVSIKVGDLENSRSDLEHWYFMDEKDYHFPDGYSWDNVVIPDDKISEEIDEWLLLTKTRSHYLDELKSKYYTLIDSSRNYEEVIHVWEEALEVKDRIVSATTSLTALSQGTIDAIKDDIASRNSVAA